MTPRCSVRSAIIHFKVSDVSIELRRSGRDIFHQFQQGIPDGELVAALLNSATGPPRKAARPASESQRSLPSKESPYFDVATHVAQATVDLDLSGTITATDMSRRLGERRREAKATNGQYSQDFGHKLFGSGKYGFTISFPHSDRLDTVFVQRVHAVGRLWWTRGRPLHVLDGGAPP